MKMYGTRCDFVIEDVLVAEQKKHISCHQTGEAIYISNRNSDRNTSRILADQDVLVAEQKTPFL